jgi:sulfite reductase alpha subunit-like flavoprotein
VTLCIELNTGDNSGELIYKPGDHLAVFGRNRKELVDAVIARVSDSPDVIEQISSIEVLKQKPSIFGNYKS